MTTGFVRANLAADLSRVLSSEALPRTSASPGPAARAAGHDLASFPTEEQGPTTPSDKTRRSTAVGEGLQAAGSKRADATRRRSSAVETMITEVVCSERADATIRRSSAVETMIIDVVSTTLDHRVLARSFTTALDQRVITAPVFERPTVSGSGRKSGRNPPSVERSRDHDHRCGLDYARPPSSRPVFHDCARPGRRVTPPCGCGRLDHCVIGRCFEGHQLVLACRCAHRRQ